jgi:predicted DNA-binding protein (MmcQ/YjbR family)
MDIEKYREYCLNLPESTESMPFGPDVLVFKVKNKIFALFSIEKFEYINLKATPENSTIWRQEYEQWVKPGYHMNKKHWNSVSTEIPDKLLLEWTLHSYNLIIGKKTKTKLP